ELRAPYRGRSTPVNAWWGGFDLAVSLFSGAAAEPPADDFILRNSMDAQEIAVGWGPGDSAYPHRAVDAYAPPAQESLPDIDLPAGRWDTELREFVLDWDDVVAAADPRQTALDFCRTFARKACRLCGWNPLLAGTVDSVPPPVR